MLLLTLAGREEAPAAARGGAADGRHRAGMLNAGGRFLNDLKNTNNTRMLVR